MDTSPTRSQYRSSVESRKSTTSEDRAKARARERHRRKIRRQLSQRPHWSLYVGVSLLALGVVAVVAAALLTR
ncbi:hypothetical protein AB0N73_05900 [Microbacterium sp. NPDC089189]|uniref:hypothetical protein n=1 Tax=Microbacterium sp. NPDC089189 TaxID=3154972 RepID=UPI00341A6D5C